MVGRTISDSGSGRKSEGSFSQLFIDEYSFFIDQYPSGEVKYFSLNNLAEEAD
jgi:hypothetical protein